MDNRVCISFCIIVFFCVLLSLLISVFPKIFEIYQERRMLLENEFELFDEWNRRPLTQQQIFYIYNITNGDEFLSSDVPMEVSEIGPFVYDAVRPVGNLRNASDSINYLEFKDMKFISKNSIASDSSVIHTLNVPLIRIFYEKGIGVKISKSLRNVFKLIIIRKITVREALRELMDGNSLENESITQFSEFLSTSREDDSFDDTLNENQYFQDYSESSYTNYFVDELCLEFFSIFRMVNVPVYKNETLTSRVFEGFPCKCLNFKLNGTDVVTKTQPETFNLQTNRYSLHWDDKSCAGMPNKFHNQLFADPYTTKDFLTISSHIYFDDKDYIRYNSKMDSEDFLQGSYLNIEPMSDTISEMVFRYQFNILMGYGDEPSGIIFNEIYPILLTIIKGKSTSDVDYSMFRYIVFPHIFTHNILPKILFFAICILISAVVFTLMIVMGSNRREENEVTPLLNVTMQRLV